MVGHDTFSTVARSFMSNMVLLLPISTSEEQESNVKKDHDNDFGWISKDGVIVEGGMCVCGMWQCGVIVDSFNDCKSGTGATVVCGGGERVLVPSRESWYAIRCCKGASRR